MSQYPLSINKNTFFTTESESGKTITMRTERENNDINFKLKVLNPVRAKKIVKDDEAGRVLETMRQEHKRITLSLKQLITTGVYDRTFEPNKAYPLEIYPDRIP